MRILAIAAAAMLIAGAAFAQSAIEKPGQPGSGYKSPEVSGVNNPTQTPAGIAPTGADPAHPQPGEGYKSPSGPSAQAPATPAVTEGGSLPTHHGK